MRANTRFWVILAIFSSFFWIWVACIAQRATGNWVDSFEWSDEYSYWWIVRFTNIRQWITYLSISIHYLWHHNTKSSMLNTGFLVPLENFSVIWRRHHCRWRASNFDLCSAIMAIEQWGFFSVLHLLWHGASVYNGHLQGPLKYTHIAKRLAVELSLPVLTT